ncbi:hypothetical protein [Polaromonas naphthalenivorans]|uniref:hypothetical protein n=1 Tax=Polaromonas naphthalenivorans TaxID=216465 RepID=UPI0012EDD574|nr:hypothetical protein [Polaromonas naphthalenivorans]
MANLEQPPTPRKERKLSHLTLYFPVTAKIGTIGIYRLDAGGLRLVRRLTGVKLEQT